MFHGVTLILLTAVISGISIFLNKFGVTGIDSGVYTFLKNSVTAMFLFSLLLFFKNKVYLNVRQWFSLIVVGIIGGSIPFLLFFKGLQLTSGVSASFLHKTMFIFVALFATLFLKEKINKRIFVAIALLMLGNYLLLKPSFGLNLGDALILLATFFWAVENTYSKHLLRSINANTIAWARMFFGSIFILVYLVITGAYTDIFSLTASQVIWIAGTAILLFLYQVTWYNGLKSVDVSFATALLLLGSPITTALNFIMLGQISFLEIVSALLIILGVALYSNKTRFSWPLTKKV